jgi:hypothetical protein
MVCNQWNTLISYFVMRISIFHMAETVLLALSYNVTFIKLFFALNIDIEATRASRMNPRVCIVIYRLEYFKHLDILFLICPCRVDNF